MLTGIFRFQDAIIKLLHTALQKNIYNFVIIFLQLQCAKASFRKLNNEHKINTKTVNVRVK